ncbi:hypothetical protein OHAE_1696 [Ochrobactrum soli]|uniref:Uncharacterized protein n=1 Tax=Ochrobactrum soli TaxID=2448455 RepID=A0A2P9HP46_9HYPH|nr:hypothetical protein OHAE_1696 [[Ochrobactrum] soli]
MNSVRRETTGESRHIYQRNIVHHRTKCEAVFRIARQQKTASVRRQQGKLPPNRSK